jgi:hypothetical protein
MNEEHHRNVDPIELQNGQDDLTPIELSESDLDDISGGLDLIISGSFFDQSESTLAQAGTSGVGGSTDSSFANNSNTSSGNFQIMGLGFESPGQIFAVFSGLARLFGR